MAEAPQGKKGRSGAKPAVYRNTAAFLEGGDKPLAEDILLAGQKKYPTEIWMMALGQHYAQALLGSTGPLAEFNVVRQLSMKEAHGPYAQSVRNKLANSNDPHLLTQSAQWLMAWGRHFLHTKEKPLDFDFFAVARSYNDRALSVQPDYRPALSMKTAIEETRTLERIRNARVESLDCSRPVENADLSNGGGILMGKDGPSGIQSTGIAGCHAEECQRPRMRQCHSPRKSEARRNGPSAGSKTAVCPISVGSLSSANH